MIDQSVCREVPLILSSGMGADASAFAPQQLACPNLVVSDWPQPSEGDVYVRQIHGDKDRMFPIGNTRSDEIVGGGGHVISLTHAKQVNEFPRREMVEIASVTS